MQLGGFDNLQMLLLIIIVFRNMIIIVIRNIMIIMTMVAQGREFYLPTPSAPPDKELDLAGEFVHTCRKYILGHFEQHADI